MVANYHESGKRLRDYLFDGGLRGRVFVDINDGNKPYVVIPPSKSHPWIRGKAILLTEVCAFGACKDSQLLDHLEDPEYCPSKVDSSTPIDWRVDRHRLASALLASTAYE